MERRTSGAKWFGPAVFVFAGLASAVALAAPSSGPLSNGPLSDVPRGSLTTEVEDVDLQTLTSIDYQEGQPLPSSVSDLNGKTVRLKGFMFNETSEGSHKFLLVGDGCGCEGTPKVQHTIEIDLGSDVTGYRPELLTITGRLSVGELREDGYVVSIYRLVADSVE